ncbi:MAG: hypothetical protein AAB420_00935 [Patescibacteria group bacterium]
MEQFKPKHTLEELRQHGAETLEQRKEVLRKKIRNAIAELHVADEQLEAKDKMMRAFDEPLKPGEDGTPEFTPEQKSRTDNLVHFQNEQKDRWDKVKESISEFMLVFPGSKEFDDFLLEYMRRYDDITS